MAPHRGGGAKCAMQDVKGALFALSHLKGVRHGQTNDAGAQRVFSHHGENGSSQDHTVTNKLQVDCQPSVDVMLN